MKLSLSENIRSAKPPGRKPFHASHVSVEVAKVLALSEYAKLNVARLERETGQLDEDVG